MRTFLRTWHRPRNVIAAVAAPWIFATVDGGHVGTLPPSPGPRGARTAVQAAIERQPVCIGSSVASAGELADTLYYRAVATDDGRIAVGYFAFFSEERPWGNNWLTWTVAPALAVDAFYSRTLLVAPGVQRALYGAGDIEGVTIYYRPAANGSLVMDEAVAEDRDEHLVHIPRDRALALDPARPTFYSDVWSHQLGGTAARSRSDLVYDRCYGEDAIRPLPDAVARVFRVEGRASAAHVEHAGATRLDATTPATGPGAADADDRAQAASVRAPPHG